VAGQRISAEVKRFIQSTIDSAEQLEVLIFMMSNADASWSANEVAEQTRLSQESVREKLQSLADADLLVTESEGSSTSYKYLPNSSALADEVAQSLETAYAEGRETILQLIYSKPLKNIKIFADAFKIRRDE
jgi:hypothetical protein